MLPTPWRAGKSKELANGGFVHLLILEADHFFSQDALTIVNERRGQSEDAAELLLERFGGYRERITDSNFASEGSDGLGVSVESKSDYKEAAVAVAVQEFLISRHLLAARLAPRGPKIDQYYLAPQAARRKRVAGNVSYGKFREARADFARGW